MTSPTTLSVSAAERQSDKKISSEWRLHDKGHELLSEVLKKILVVNQIQRDAKRSIVQRRKAQNRNAQRAYRARKEAEMIKYKEKISQLEGRIKDLEQQKTGVIALNEYLIRVWFGVSGNHTHKETQKDK
jgi:hypothetical protein